MSTSQGTIVCSLTDEGRKFRPSDWIERIACLAATYKDKRLKYSNYLYPSTYNGEKVLIIFEDELKNEEPELHKFIMSFVQNNHLVCEPIHNHWRTYHELQP